MSELEKFIMRENIPSSFNNIEIIRSVYFSLSYLYYIFYYLMFLEFLNVLQNIHNNIKALIKILK